MLEPEAARLAAERATEADRAELRALLDELDARRDERADRPRRADPPRDLPRGHNDLLEETLEQYYVLALRIWSMALDRAHELEEAVEEHRALLEAIARRRRRARGRDDARACRELRAGDAPRAPDRVRIVTDELIFPAAAPAPSSIGAGIVGNSLVGHLAELGWRDLVLLDKGPLPNPGGSTGHASNFIFPVDHSKEMTQLTLDSMRQYREAGTSSRVRRHRGRAHRGADAGAAPPDGVGEVVGHRRLPGSSRRRGRRSSCRSSTSR